MARNKKETEYIIIKTRFPTLMTTFTNKNSDLDYANEEARRIDDVSIQRRTRRNEEGRKKYLYTDSQWMHMNC